MVDTQERSVCLHHWVIDPPAGPVSTGTCRSCGEERDFPTDPPSGPWGTKRTKAEWEELRKRRDD